jgi:serine/threonine protein kinase
MAGAFPPAVPPVLGPGSLLGPGQLGQRYRITGIINTTDGNFAEVFIVMLEPPPPNPISYAVKVSRDRGGARRGWEHELRVMERVADAKCPYLAALKDYFEDPATGRLCIVMKRYEESLQEVLMQGRPTAQVVWGWAEDMARGLAVLHELGIIHLDVELRNVFVDDKRRAVLGDLGASLLVRGATTGGVVLSSRGGLKVDPHSVMTAPSVRAVHSALLAGHVAQHRRIAGPVVEEVFMTAVSPKDDVWALGCVLLRLTMGPNRPLTLATASDLAGLELPARSAGWETTLQPWTGDLETAWRAFARSGWRG